MLLMGPSEQTPNSGRMRRLGVAEDIRWPRPGPRQARPLASASCRRAGWRGRPRRCWNTALALESLESSGRALEVVDDSDSHLRHQAPPDHLGKWRMVASTEGLGYGGGTVGCSGLAVGRQATLWEGVWISGGRGRVSRAGRQPPRRTRLLECTGRSLEYSRVPFDRVAPRLPDETGSSSLPRSRPEASRRTGIVRDLLLHDRPVHVVGTVLASATWATPSPCMIQ